CGLPVAEETPQVTLHHQIHEDNQDPEDDEAPQHGWRLAESKTRGQTRVTAVRLPVRRVPAAAARASPYEASGRRGGSFPAARASAGHAPPAGAPAASLSWHLPPHRPVLTPAGARCYRPGFLPQVEPPSDHAPRRYAALVASPCADP